MRTNTNNVYLLLKILISEIESQNMSVTLASSIRKKLVTQRRNPKTVAEEGSKTDERGGKRSVVEMLHDLKCCHLLKSDLKSNKHWFGNQHHSDTVVQVGSLSSLSL